MDQMWSTDAMNIHYNNASKLLEILNLPEFNTDDFYIVKHTQDSFRCDINYTTDYFEIFFFENINLNIKIDNQEYKNINHGLCFISPKQQITRIINQIDTSLNSYSIFFKAEFLFFRSENLNVYESYPMFKYNTPSTYNLKQLNYFNLLEIIKNIFNEYSNNLEDSNETITLQIGLLLQYSKRQLCSNHSSLIFHSKDRYTNIVYQFEDLIRLSDVPKRSICFYSEKLNISPAYLSKCVKRTTNRTAKSIINEHIIFKTKYLLQQTSKTISEISLEMGFIDISNFVKFFKKNTGLTPKKYRIQKQR